ncbi:MAG: cation diffusion facilitator family transporter [Rhodanobacteraceae bacterium]
MQHIHSHDEIDSAQRSRRLSIAVTLTLIILVFEAAGGWLSGSLALVADAGHMLIDAMALLFAWLAAVYARRPADARRTFGYARLEVLAGYSNSLIQFVLVGWIVIEALSRLRQPAPVDSALMFGVALAGLVLNGVVLRVLGGHDHDDVNTASARLHVIGDLLGSLGAVLAAIVIHYFGWLWSDAAISILVSLLILNSAWRLAGRSGHILLEGVPDDLDAASLGHAIEAENAGVCNVHHVHVWQLAGGNRMATLHAQLFRGTDPDSAIVGIQQFLRERFRIAHATVQIERYSCEEKACERDHADQN